MTSAARYFIPVCLYPHTKYRTSAGVTALFEKFALRSHDHLIVVADRLLVLDRLVTGRYWTVDSVTAKSRQEATQVFHLIKKVASKSGAQSSGRIAFWDDIAESDGFSEFADQLRDAVLADDLLAGAIEEFVERRVARFGLGSAPDQERDHEREYLLSEVCMSVYCTEMLGYSREVWERPPTPDISDPLKLLYDERPALVERLTGRPPARLLQFLYADAQRAAGAVFAESQTPG
jgi:hypothetical protein